MRHVWYICLRSLVIFRAHVGKYENVNNVNNLWLVGGVNNQSRWLRNVNYSYIICVNNLFIYAVYQ